MFLFMWNGFLVCFLGGVFFGVVSLWGDFFLAFNNDLWSSFDLYVGFFNLTNITICVITFNGFSSLSVTLSLFMALSLSLFLSLSLSQALSVSLSFSVSLSVSLLFINERNTEGNNFRIRL